ncbi:MAG TPA: nuclear transport factor 2 family protein [Solirubrobacterales bacterium]|nr:nuclear transport factor 2 family protein [Solirubrobacterales bacterium]
MYKTIAKRKVTGVFDALGRGDWEAGLADAADDVHHVFPGDHALGGERHSKEAMGRWFERVYRLIPDLQFEVESVAVRGLPWDMRVAVKWRDFGRMADGEPYENHGAHWIRLQRGKAKSIRAYLDTQSLADSLERMRSAGIEEAGAAPITG